MMVCSDNKKAFAPFVIVIMVLVFVKTSESNCGYEAIFNFGDSNCDTGEYYTAFPPLKAPYGMTFFGKPSGRPSDGRLIIDFIAQGFGYPYLSPYFESIGSDFRHGVNFATNFASILSQSELSIPALSPFSLQVQLNQFKDYKSKVGQRNNQGNVKVPQPDVFNKSIYTFYIGQNDFVGSLYTSGIIGARRNFRRMISKLNSTINELYNLGGRTFMVQNLAPIGCLSRYLLLLNHTNSDVDKFGCMISYNNLVVEYNDVLKQALQTIRQQISDAQLIYVDTHSVLLDLFQSPTTHGLKYGVKTCCGYGGGAYNFDPRVNCGERVLIDNVIVEAKACSDPLNYAVWDGVHMTEAANKIVAQAIISGAYFDPPFTLKNKCNVTMP